MGAHRHAGSPPPPSLPGNVTFRWRPFANPARKDGLELSHWVKCFKDAQGNVSPADGGEYVFAKYNKKVQGSWCALVGALETTLRKAERGRLPTRTPLPVGNRPVAPLQGHTPSQLQQERVLRYNDEEWDHIVTQEPSWSREESDYLLDLAEQLDLRWLVIADRYEVRDCCPVTGWLGVCMRVYFCVELGARSMSRAVADGRRPRALAVPRLRLGHEVPQVQHPFYPRKPPPQFKPDQSRSVEELKARYYTIARDLLVRQGARLRARARPGVLSRLLPCIQYAAFKAEPLSHRTPQVKRAGGEELVANHPLIRHPYHIQHERERKKGLELLFERTKAQEEVEDAILAEAVTIETARKAEEAAARRASAAEAGGSGSEGTCFLGCGWRKYSCVSRD